MSANSTPPARVTRLSLVALGRAPHFCSVQASPSSQSSSEVQASSSPMLDEHPGNPGGQSAGSLHLAGGERPGKCNGGDLMLRRIFTLIGFLADPLVAISFPSAS